MTVPIDANAGVGESFVPSIERNVVIDFSLVLVGEVPCTGQARLFISGKDKNQIAFGLDLSAIKRTHRSQQSLDVSRVIANTRTINPAVANSGFDFQARLKDSIKMGIEHHNWSTSGSLAHRNQVSY